METRLLTSLGEFSYSLYQHLLSKGLRVDLQKTGDDIKHIYHGYSYRIQPVSRVLALVLFDDTPGAPATYVAMTNKATEELAQEIMRRYLEYTGVQETAHSVQEDIDTYLNAPANRGNGDYWFTHKQRSDAEYSFYFEAIADQPSNQSSGDSFVVNVALKDVALLQALLQYSHSHFYQCWTGCDHIKAAMSIIHKANSDKGFDFKPKQLDIHSTAAVLRFDLDGDDRIIVITYGCRGMVFYTDLHTKQTQSVVMVCNHSELVFDHYDVFKDFVTGRVAPDIIKKE